MLQGKQAFFPILSTVLAKQYADNVPYQYTEYDHFPCKVHYTSKMRGEAWKRNPVHTQYPSKQYTSALNCIRYQN